MLSVNINSDVEKYEESVIGTFNAQQSIYIIISFFVGVGAFCLFFLALDFGIVASCYLSIPFIIPVIIAGFGKKDGVSFYRRIINILTLRKKPLLYSCSYVNYERIEEEELQNKKKKGFLSFNVKKSKKQR